MSLKRIFLIMPIRCFRVQGKPKRYIIHMPELWFETKKCEQWGAVALAKAIRKEKLINRKHRHHDGQPAG